MKVKVKEKIKQNLKEIFKNKYNKDINNLYFIGIGGTSMSGLATIANQMDFSLEGTDNVASDYVNGLIEKGIKVNIGHKADNITNNIDLIVYSAAIHDDNPEMIRAQELGIPTIERSEYLGLLSRAFEVTIGVAGTHGKTTTSSMISQILYDAGLDPSVTIGGKLDRIGGNSYLGSDDYFIVESCEFVDSFLHTQHKIAIITNIEKDHLDYFKKGITQIIESFHKFASIVPKDGLLIACGDDPNVRKACEGLECPIIYYGLEDSNDWTVKNLKYNPENGYPTFDVYNHGNKFGTFTLEVTGLHNVLNSLSAIICANYLDIPLEDIESALSTFKGAHRRYEFKGEVNDIKVYEDYAHHPTELSVVIDGALNEEPKNLWVVFQPHTYSRTYLLFDEFVDSFKKADKIILNDIYSDRETNEKYHIYSEDLAKHIKEKYHKPTVVLSEFDTITKFIADNAEPGDLVLVAGSQTINKVATKLVNELEKRYL